VDESGTGSYYVQYAYPWGYADNYPNNDDRSNFNIEWAVDAEGNPVYLPAIHFVKVYTGVNQYCGWLGETSTEVMGAEDLHPDAEPVTSISNINRDKEAIRLLKNPVKDWLIIESPGKQVMGIYNFSGQKIRTEQLIKGINELNCSSLPKGFYIVVSNNRTIKFIKQ
jgi:hypothetical protein